VVETYLCFSGLLGFRFGGGVIMGRQEIGDEMIDIRDVDSYVISRRSQTSHACRDFRHWIGGIQFVVAS